jgi:hypothetical protein
MNPIVSQLLANRELDVPDEDREALDAHWTKMRSLRTQVDESLLADNEIAVTFDAAGAQHE